MSVDQQDRVARIEAIGREAPAAIRACGDARALEEARVRFLGKKSEFSAIQRGLGELDGDERRRVGRAVNAAREAIQRALDETGERLRRAERDRALAAETIDVTLPGRPASPGAVHPLTRVMGEIEAIFVSMGFEIATGPEMETEHYNFEALNIPPDHPARDMHDTFYLESGGVLRTHTSPVQIRAMLGRPPPIAIVAPGKVYRRDADATHSPMFHQVEGLLVAEGVSFSDLKGVLAAFLRRFFGREMKTRFRPSHFPFTEPSAEVDVLWESGGRSKWLEVLGCGMVHPFVLRAGGYDPDRVSGFAFGMGVERFAMLKFGIGDIRLFYESDLRFLRQF